MVTIGGGYVMFPLMKREVVDSKQWISDEEMVDYYALGQSVPGIIAMNSSAAFFSKFAHLFPEEQAEAPKKAAPASDPTAEIAVALAAIRAKRG